MHGHHFVPSAIYCQRLLFSFDLRRIRIRSFNLKKIFLCLDNRCRSYSLHLLWYSCAHTTSHFLCRWNNSSNCCNFFWFGYCEAVLIAWFLQSYDIHEAAYFVDWYKLDIRNQRLISLVILRAQTPCGVVVPFFESSLQTFTTVILNNSNWAEKDNFL